MVNARLEIPVLADNFSIPTSCRIGAPVFVIADAARGLSHIYIIGGSGEILKEFSWILWLAFSGH